jgi:hypothetical protein
MLRRDGRNALTSRAYARDFNKVQSVGSLTSTTRTADQTDAAIFWHDHIFALWNRVFRILAADHGLPIADSARLCATANLAAADAAIGCWNDKYHWNSWRPITAIRETDSDGTPCFSPALCAAGRTRAGRRRGGVRGGDRLELFPHESSDASGADGHRVVVAGSAGQRDGRREHRLP